MRIEAGSARSRQLYIIIGAIALLALALRIAAAQGALWLDEAWSAVFAHEAGSPAGVFFKINHDNNHHLNSLWMQLTGWGAPPLLTRALSIVTGALTVIVAGLIGARGGLLTATLTAALFAISPIMVSYGSEARGYAPMLLLLVSAIWIVDRWLQDRTQPPPARLLAIIVALGMLAHLTMLLGLAALATWSFFSPARAMPTREALSQSVRLNMRALLAAVAILALVMIAAWASPAGFQVGGFEPFTYRKFLEGFGGMLAYTIGIPPGTSPSIIIGGASIAALAAMFLLSDGRDRLPFYAAAIFGLPLAVIVLQIGNSGFPRYYLISSVACLLLLGEMLASALRYTDWRRIAAAAAAFAIFMGSMALNAELVENRRGDAGQAIAAMRQRAPGGSIVLIGQSRDRAVIEAAAASYGYSARIVENSCPARFLFVEQPGGPAPFPTLLKRCGKVYRPIASARTTGLSGMSWYLYAGAG
jgi:hypothetical protein